MFLPYVGIGHNSKAAYLQPINLFIFSFYVFNAGGLINMLTVCCVLAVKQF